MEKKSHFIEILDVPAYPLVHNEIAIQWVRHGRSVVHRYSCNWKACSVLCQLSHTACSIEPACLQKSMVLPEALLLWPRFLS